MPDKKVITPRILAFYTLKGLQLLAVVFSSLFVLADALALITGHPFTLKMFIEILLLLTLFTLARLGENQMVGHPPGTAPE